MSLILKTLTKILHRTYYSKILLITLFLISIIFSNCENELARNLQIEFNRISKSFPNDWQNYILTMESNGQLKIDKFHLNEIDFRFNKIHRFNQDVIYKFNSIVYAESVVFKTFSFSITNSNSFYNEFVGAARVVNDQVEIAYFQVDTSANLKPLFNAYKRNVCWKIFFFFEKCEERIVNIPRGHTFQEMELIYDTLKAHSYVHLIRTTENILSALQSKEFVLSQNSPLYSSSGEFYIKIQEDGNLVIYATKEKMQTSSDCPIWASQTFHMGRHPYMLVIEKNGDLIIYDNLWNWLWKADIKETGLLPYSIELSNEGDLILVDKDNKIIWKSVKDKFVNLQKNIEFLEDKDK